MRDRVPMWLAVAITVALSLPFGLWLGDYALPLWAAFIVWAEYFVLGARPEALRLIIPAFFVGVFGALGITTANVILERLLVDASLVAENDIAAFMAFFLASASSSMPSGGCHCRSRRRPRCPSSTASR